MSVAAASGTTVIVVAFRTPRLELSWVPAGTPVIVVHNDDSLDENAVVHDSVRHLRSGDNLGFGRAVNAALPLVQTRRILLCNPDVVATRAHWQALDAASPDELMVVPLADGSGRPTSVVNRYPTPLTLLLSAYRVGRMAPRGSRLRRALGMLLGAWGRAHHASLQMATGEWALRDHWASGAMLSVDTERMRAVGGFDDGYFLYYEDVDLCRRLGRRFPAMRVRMAGTEPGVHAVGASAAGGLHSATEKLRFASAARYCRSQRGVGWQLCALALRPRAALAAGRPGPA